jgi:uroporphyrinogen decarboxylase
MTSKERVLCAINLSEPDRVPMNFGANNATRERLYQDLDVKSHKELLEKLNIDIVDIRGVVDPIYKGPVPFERFLDNRIKENFWGMRTKLMQTATGPEECYCDFIFKNVDDIWELEKHSWPEADWFDFSDIDKELEEWSNFAIMASGASVFQHPTFLRSIDNLLTDMIINEEIAHYLMDKFTDFYVQYFDRMFVSAKGKVDILRIADDLGMQDRLIISPEIFEKFFVPRIKRIADMAHSHGVKVMFHSCGSIVPFIPRLIDIGIDILDPIQVRAKGMNPEYLKDSFGDRICLHGSIDTQYVLPKGTKNEVANEVKKMIDILGRGGGFILSPSHVFQTDVVTDNIVALYETGYRYSTR